MGPSDPCGKGWEKLAINALGTLKYPFCLAVQLGYSLINVILSVKRLFI